MKSILHPLVTGGVLFCVAFGMNGIAQEKASGIKIGNLTLSPFVNLEWNYDSNVDLDRLEYDDWYLRVNPGLDLTYTGNDWGVNGQLWFSYDKYHQYSELNEPRFGGRFSEYWESDEKWRVVLGQSYMESKSNDSVLEGGRGIWRNRSYLDLNGAVSYQFSERTGATASGQYSKVDYANDGEKYGYLYGWEEWSVGLELARKLTEKSNLLLSGSYQMYEQDNAKEYDPHNAYNNYYNFDRKSVGYSLMAGLGSRATERITYRGLMGVNWFDYGRQGNTQGWTYQLNGNWLISKKWAASIAGSSYFQPSETEANQSMQAYTISGGATYRPIKRLTIRGDLGYRREDDQYERLDYGKKMTDHIYSARLRADYQFVKHTSVYAGVDYVLWKSDEDGPYPKDEDKGYQHEYDRLLLTVGLKLRY